MVMKTRWFLILMYLITVTAPSTPQGIPGEFEKIHYDITSSSRIDALSNTGYSYNCGIASSCLNPSLISDTGLALSRFGISYGFSFTPPKTIKPEYQFYYDKSIHEFSLKKHHVTFKIPCLSKKRNLGGVGIDLDHLNFLEYITRFYPNSTGSISEKSNLLTFSYGLPFLTLNNFKNFIGLSAKVNFYNRTEDNPYPENFYDEMKEVRYLFDISYSAYLFGAFHLSCILRNIPLEKKAKFAFPFQLIIPVSYQFNLSEKVSLTPEFSYQYNGSMIDINNFSAGSELNINRFLFLRIGCTLEIKKFQGGEFEYQNDDLIETAFKFGSGIGLNIIKGIVVDASYKRNYQANYFGITITYQAY